jgi:cyclopropane-fatty-acyl-phospholipid synthase
MSRPNLPMWPGTPSVHPAARPRDEACSIPQEPPPLRRWLRRLVGPVPPRVELWNGTGMSLSDGPPVARVRLRRASALLGVALDPAGGFAEAYRRGHVEVEGDLAAALRGAFAARPPVLPRRTRSRRTARRAARDGRRHYDIGNDFFRLWLDERMVYSCAYFEDPGAGLDAAQVAKMDHICRKLDLRPGESVLDVGCGWGGLARHMAARYGARVTACNVSPEQIRWARARTREDGLENRITYVEDDFRNLRSVHDAFVSVGMLEHVGRAHYLEMGRTMRECLVEGGRGVMHFMGRTRPERVSRWIRRHIFPGTHAPALSEVTRLLFEPWDRVTDVENLRQHYARTLALWRERFERHAAEIAARFDLAFVRTWRLYLAGSEAAFASGRLQLFQITFARERDAVVPWTRAGLYAHARPRPTY